MNHPSNTITESDSININSVIKKNTIINYFNTFNFYLIQLIYFYVNCKNLKNKFLNF